MPASVVSGLVSLIISLALAGLPSSAAAGPRPDPTFGGGRGFVTTPFPGGSMFADAAIVTPNNRLVVAGQSIPAHSLPQISVARYQSNGALDRTFGSNGIFTSTFPAADGPFRATAIQRQPSTGALVVAGGYGDGSILVLRLTTAGQLDPSFGPGGAGYVKVVANGFGDSLAIDSAGRILVGSANGNVEGRPFVVARFTPSGILDTTYGHGGMAQVLFWDQLNLAGSPVAGLSVAADGSIIGFGHIDPIGRGAVAMAGVFRLSPTGALVPGFGVGGGNQISFGGTVGGEWLPCAMAVDSRGRIVVTGSSSASTGPVLLSARLTPTGTLDSSYGVAGDGRVVTSGLGADVTNQPNCGATAVATDAVTIGIGSTLVQLTSKGTPSTGFAPGGIFKISAPAQVLLLAVIRGGTGRIVLAGSAGDAAYVGRYVTR